MGPYDKELMMAILTSSTTLAGLTGVVIGQIKQSGLATRQKVWLTVVLTVTFLFALGAIIYAIGWLTSPAYSDKRLAISLFALQLILFSGSVSAFWLSDVGNAKPAQRTKAALKKAWGKVRRTILAVYSWIRGQIVKLWRFFFNFCQKDHSGEAKHNLYASMPIASLSIAAIMFGIGYAGLQDIKWGTRILFIAVFLFFPSFVLYILSNVSCISKKLTKIAKARAGSISGLILSIGIASGGLAIKGDHDRALGITIACLGALLLLVTVTKK